MGLTTSDDDEGALAQLMLRGRIDASALAKARDNATNWNTTIGEVLVAEGTISPRDWALATAASTGLPLADLIAEAPDAALLDAADRDAYLSLGVLPWKRAANGALLLAALRPAAPDVLAWAMRRYPHERLGWAVTAKFDVLWALQKRFDVLADQEAREALHIATPELSAKQVITTPQAVVGWAIGMLLLLALFLAPTTTLITLSAAITLFYLLSFGFRFLLTWKGAHHSVDVSVTDEEVAALKPEDLPVYTVLVPMYREAEVLPILVHSMRRMDYPLAKLDVKLVLEQDDNETIEAAKALKAEGVFEIIRVPTSYPKTKPKACNYALRFARGEYIVVFDAEDIPEPDQLKKAVAMFKRSPQSVGCIQARLNYFNRRENFLTRMFTLEYSNWFDYLLPGLHALKIPIPLGGTSNHFRTAVLKQLGAWDPYNVTEDADLGVRMTQQGYQVAVMNSTTFEEANGVWRSWINQRSRWIKGYMQTWLVHMRHPIKLFRNLGGAGFWGFHFFIGFPVLTALLNPVLWLTTAIGLIFGQSIVSPYFPEPIIWFALFNLVVGNAMYVYMTMVAAAKRGWFSLMPWALLAPIYWVMHSVAAYKALYQLIVKPHFWEKTQHGTSKVTQSTIADIRQQAAQ
ncbi:MAG: glycosyltransferase [Alphaproteobacteria bacterium]|nr:glycosyltransferase [Alphaproteobacteria bacterium]